MKTNVPGKIADSLIHAGVAPTEDKALYEYGIRQGILTVINILTAVLIGLLLGMVWQTVVFLIAYTPIRTNAGGYHAGTPFMCYLLSIPMMLAVLSGIKFIPWNGYLVLIVIICAGIAVFLLAPVEDMNKPLDQLEVKVYKKRSRIILTILSIVAVILWFAGIKQSSLSIVMALGMIAIMLVFGVIKNRSLTNEEKAL